MSELTYPAGLPCPRVAPLQRVERRMLSALPGPRQSRLLQRDKYSVQTLEFICRTPTQMQAWLDWYYNELGDGAHWFAADWPQPEGGVGVRRFVGAPVFAEVFRPRGGWRIQIECRIRGRGELPNTPSFVGELLIHFDDADPAKWKDYSIHRRSITLIQNDDSTIHPNASGVFAGAGRFNQAFPGSGGVPDYNTQCYLLTNGTLNLSNKEFFMEARVYLTQSPGTGAFTIASNVEPQLDGVSVKSAGWIWFIEEVAGVINHRFVCTTPGSSFGAAASGINLNEWTTLAISRVNTEVHSVVQGFVNGSQVTGTGDAYPLSLTADPTSRGVYVGAWDRAGGFVFPEVNRGYHGSMDELWCDVGDGTGIPDNTNYTVRTTPYGSD